MKTRILFVLGSLVGLTLLICVLSRCDQYKPAEDAQERAPYITYMKDTRTHLCFATYGALGSPSGVLTNVPCSDEVEKQIVLQHKRENPNE